MAVFFEMHVHTWGKILEGNRRGWIDIGGNEKSLGLKESDGKGNLGAEVRSIVTQSSWI